MQSVDLLKKNKQVKREIIELTEKSKSLEDIISTLQQGSSTESDNEKEFSKEN